MSFAVLTTQNAAAFRKMFKKHGVLKLPGGRSYPHLPYCTALAAKASCPQHCRLFLKNILGIRHDERLERLNITRQVAGIAFVVHIFADVGELDDAVSMIL